MRIEGVLVKAIDKMPELPHELGLDAEQWTTLARFFQQLVHDINNPLGTMRLELSNLEETIDDLQAALSQSASRSAKVPLEDLEEIHGALERARTKASIILDAVHGHGRRWLEEGG